MNYTDFNDESKCDAINHMQNKRTKTYNYTIIGDGVWSFGEDGHWMQKVELIFFIESLKYFDTEKFKIHTSLENGTDYLSYYKEDLPTKNNYSTFLVVNHRCYGVEKLEVSKGILGEKEGYKIYLLIHSHNPEFTISNIKYSNILELVYKKRKVVFNNNNYVLSIKETSGMNDIMQDYLDKLIYVKATSQKEVDLFFKTTGLKKDNVFCEYFSYEYPYLWYSENHKVVWLDTEPFMFDKTPTILVTEFLDKLKNL